MRKVCCCLIFVLFLIVAASGCADDRHTYSYADRVVLSVQNEKNAAGSNATGAINSNHLEWELSVADVVLEGRIVDVIEPAFETISPEVPFGLMITRYKVKVDDVWYGECDAGSIYVRIRGNENEGVSKPHLKDEVVLILREYDDGSYDLVMAENSIFVKNPPDDLIYAFSETEDCAAFDGKTVGDLKEGFQQKLDYIETTGGSFGLRGGKVAKEAFETYRRDVLGQPAETK